MPSRDPFAWIGSTIDGQFAVEAVAGEGAFGVVYRGTHLGLAAPIAIKCLKLPSELDRDARDRFLEKFREEARLLHRLSRYTLNIVQALDIGAATSPNGQWTPYTVMEWLEGETLEQDLRQRRAEDLGLRSVSGAIELLAPAASALAIAHEEGVSHRDIKPANLFLAKLRGERVAKVLDFGVAKVFAEAPTLKKALEHTGKQFQAFTPRYGAPEQFSAHFGATGPWTDVYAMALVFIEVVSGRPALMGLDAVQLFVASANKDDRPSLRSRGVEADPAIEAVIDRALAVSPAERFRSMGEMWSALEAAHGATARDAAPTAPSGPPRSVTMPPTSGGARDDGPRSAARSSPVIEENRVCTALIVDLSEATRLLDRLDAEEVQAILDRCHALVREQVEALGGLADKPSGDRVMAVFGIPRATDNDAERAILAGLRIQAEIARVALPRAAKGARLATRIGVSTGRVFVRRTLAFPREELSILGDAVNAASRLQQAAPRGGVVIGRDTYRQVVDLFHVEPLAPLEIGEHREPVQAYRVTKPIPFRPVFAPSAFYGVETKLVGRAAEKARLFEAVETVVAERRAQLVTLVGPPGVGRSRLLSELYSSLVVRSETFVVLMAQCSPLGIDTSYGLAASLIRRRFGLHESEGPAAVRRKLRRGMRWLRLHRGQDQGPSSRGTLDATREDMPPADIDDALMQMESVLGADPASTMTAGIMTLADDAGINARRRISAAAARLAAFAASRMPVVILCDDIQWADDASLDLLRDIVARSVDVPLLIVCAARPELYERRSGWGEEREGHSRIEVAPLARRFIEEMIRDRLRRAVPLSSELVRLLADRAENNPLTLVETLHLLVEAGVIEVRDDGPWQIHEGQLGALALPATIQGIVQARLDRLDAEVRGALAHAAIVGRTFWAGVVGRLREEGPTGEPDARVAEILERLRERGLIRARESSIIPGERDLLFAESATHEVAYEMLPLKLRRTLHLRTAEWIEEHAVGGTVSALLAMHYERGEDLRRAASAHARAAAHAGVLGDSAEARSHLERVREIHDEASDEDAREHGQDLRIAPWRDRVRVRLELGDVLRREGRLDDADRAYEEARARILRRERRAGAALEAGEVLAWEARIDFRLALSRKVRGSIAEALELVGRAIASGTEAGIVDELPPMYALLAILHRRGRRLDASWQAARRGLRVCRSLHRRDERFRENVAQLLLGVAVTQYSRRQWVRAERSYRQASRIVSEAANPELVGVALNGVAGARLGRGDLKGAREMLLRSLRLKERGGNQHQIAVAYSNLAEVELKLKDVSAALEHARRSVRLGEQIRAGSDLADMYKNLAEAALARGELGTALDAGSKALSVAEAAGRVYLGEVAVTLAKVCATIAREPSSDAGARDRALDAEKTLRALLAKHANDDDLRSAIEACHSVLSPATLS